jgi:hypothetical protein
VLLEPVVEIAAATGFDEQIILEVIIDWCWKAC